MIRSESQVRALSKAVARAFNAADLTPEERQPSQVLHTDLTWQVPPLLVDATINGIDLSDYFDMPVSFEPKSLIKFWHKALHDLWHTPSTTMRNSSYAALTGHWRTVKQGIKAFRFALPPGYPGQFDFTAGIQLSLEVAHMAYISLPCKPVMTLDDYYVVLGDGTELGVKAGRPAIESSWEYDASGQVLDFLEAGRGPVTQQCLFDQVSMIRSVLHTYPEKFGSNFRGMDLALQALRTLSLGSYCPDMVTAVQVVEIDMGMWSMREKRVREAKEAMDCDNLNDRQKLTTLKSLLVPEVISLTAFRKHIYPADLFPFAMTLNRAEKVKDWLHTYYETEIPCNLRRSPQ